MSTQGEQPDGRGTEEFRDSGLDQDHLAEAFEEMEAAPEGGALLEGEAAEESDGSADADGPSDAEGGADVASGGGEGRREPTSGAVGEQGAQAEGGDGADR